MRKLPSFSTLTEALDSNAAHDKHVTFIEGAELENRFSYAELRQRALGLLKNLQDRGINQGDELIVFTKNNQQFAEAFWACLYGGIVPVPVAVGISDEHRAKLFRIFAKLDRAHLFTDADNFRHLRNYAEHHDAGAKLAEVESKTVLVEQLGDLQRPGTAAEIQAETRAFIQFSSGSTSEPKGVILTHHNLITTIVAIGERAEYTEADSSLSWMPLTHDLGLIGYHLSPIIYNMSQYLIPTEVFSRRPMIWLKKAAQHGASILTSPNFGFKHFLKTYTRDKFGDANLSRVRLILNGAEPISIELCEQFLDTMQRHKLPRSAMYTVYGLAEACLGVSLPIPGKEFEYVSINRHKAKVGDAVEFLQRGDKDALSFAIEGPVVINCEVKITNFDNQTLPADTIGEVQIKGPNVTSGYYKDEAANAKAFTGDGWLNTGDVGFMHQGQLVITGRTKDIIFINGQNYYPHDLETIVQQYCDIELGKVAAGGLTQDIAAESELLIFILDRGDLTDFVQLAKRVRHAINEHMGLEVSQVLPVSRIPKTTSGKVQRHSLVNDYLDGTFSAVISKLTELNKTAKQDEPLELTDIEAALLAVGEQSITDKDVSLNDNLFDIGISSLVLSEIHQQIDERYPGLVDITDMFEYQSLADLASFIQSKQ